MSRGALPELLKHQGQLLQGNAQAPHDVHDLAVFGLQLVFLQLLEPGLLLVDFGLDLSISAWIFWLLLAAIE